MSKYRLREQQKEPAQLTYERESNEPSPTASIYGFAIGFAAGLLSCLGIINFIIPVGIEFISLILSVLLISMFMFNIYAMKKARNSD